ncbi:MAG: hypothetical protein ABIJ45_12405 [Candidatus Zixiibacteriota bacterium]
MKPNLALVKLSEITALTDINNNKVEAINNMINDFDIIRNPLAVMPCPDKSGYYLLEDSSILESLRRAELEYVPAQIVDSADSFSVEIVLYTGENILPLLDEFNRLFPRALMMSTEDKSGKDLNDGVLVSIENQNHPIVIVSFRRLANKSIPLSFFNFLKFIKTRSRAGGSFYPFEIKSKNIKEFSTISAISTLNINFDDILTAVKSGHLFPSLSLHFKFDYRILGIDFPLTVLKSEAVPSEKEKFYFDLVNFRLSSGSSEFVGNNVYFLNY